MKKLNKRTKLVILSFVIFILLTSLYIWGLLIPEDAVRGSYMNAKEAPSLSHPFGTDALGRDLFLRTIKGFSVSLTVGLSASLISVMIALFASLGAATGSEIVDAVINWIIDLVMSIPHIILIILISFIVGRGTKGLVIGIALTHWCASARLIRGEVLQIRKQYYVAFSRKNGKSGLWIMMNHMLPCVLPQFLVSFIITFPHAILHEASVSFLGFGLTPEKSSIGIILSESMRYISTGMWWAMVFPGAMLVALILLFDKLSGLLSTILDPVSREE